MTLENLIYESILYYPGLFYYPDIKTSRIAVLKHYFLTLGSGFEFNENGELERTPSNKIDNIIKVDNLKERIDRGEKIVQVFEKKSFKVKDIFFLTDLKEGYIDNLPENYKAEIFPDENSERNDLTPYPFYLYYCEFVRVNPHFKKYTYDTISNMTVEELSESKNFIKPDCIEGIVEVYQWAHDWFNSTKYDNDSYYNPKCWTNSNELEVYSDSDKLERLSKFSLPEDMIDSSVEEVKKFLSNRTRTKFINNCAKIIEAFK